MAKPIALPEAVRRDALRVTTTVQVLAAQCKEGLSRLFGTDVEIVDDDNRYV